MSYHETNYKASYGAVGLIKGDSDYVMMDINLSLPSSDKEFKFDIDITMQTPEPKSKALWPEFGLHREPSKQSVSVLTSPNSGYCKATFLFIPFNDEYGTSTANWPEGEYIVDISLSGGLQAYEQAKFTLK